jgi:hypothetical protein
LQQYETIDVDWSRLKPIEADWSRLKSMEMIKMIKMIVES